MTNQQLISTLQTLSLPHNLSAVVGIIRGIERETLRITEQGRLSSKPHSAELGSALTHKYITTDFSEALLEFITPAQADSALTLKQLEDIHKFTLSKLDDEILWPISMPCFIKHQDEIALAQYGTSNTGQMKTLYREGLKNRYGSMMQAIAGVHFNISFPESFWLKLQELQNDTQDLQDFISASYLAVIRNFKRNLWLISYLFGASPALCSSFLQGRETKLPFESFGKGSLYLPYGTALRLGDLGYTNSAQSALNVTYNNLDDYIAGIRSAITTPSGLYNAIGDYPDGRRKQLNHNILQIENEFYSPIRPKRNTLAGEKPSEALARGGIEYIEVRALDVNPFSSVGISLEQMRFLDVFLTYCALESSPLMSVAEQAQASANLSAVVNNGRDPELVLSRNGEATKLQTWGANLFADLALVADYLDKAYKTDEYSHTIATLSQWIVNPEMTFSGQYMSKLLASGLDNGAYAFSLAQAYKAKFAAQDYSTLTADIFAEQAKHSLQQQREIEQNDTVSFETFLADYFA
ncbi:glutamate--cysteine ligase [Pseudoalteromonas tunicata]|uniref:glutamate--cysteine ligase n=1 Tax=Pseudoalteromonas tunicata TaxID=314281 RepID=UPI0027400D39|nr:glutamate--cysteine ligase [Pseudoalteromonas tunicata]MDP5213041.1 glutamate--cysteine ligase [Pseudoalteromonas tunicata]